MLVGVLFKILIGFYRAFEQVCYADGGCLLLHLVQSSLLLVETGLSKICHNLWTLNFNHLSVLLFYYWLQIAIPLLYSHDFPLLFTDCDSDISGLGTLPSHMRCNLQEVCSGVVCCMEVDFLQRRIQANVTLDTCNHMLIVTVERLVVEIDLFGYQFGKSYVP